MADDTYEAKDEMKKTFLFFHMCDIVFLEFPVSLRKCAVIPCRFCDEDMTRE